jgi:hypothetical protein
VDAQQRVEPEPKWNNDEATMDDDVLTVTIRVVVVVVDVDVVDCELKAPTNKPATLLVPTRSSSCIPLDSRNAFLIIVAAIEPAARRASHQSIGAAPARILVL